MSIPSLGLAIAADFLTIFSQLPKQIQNKVTKLIDQFKKNPTKSGINYESITNSRDPNLKSIRVDQNYRAIIRKPEQGNIYLSYLLRIPPQNQGPRAKGKRQKKKYF